MRGRDGGGGRLQLTVALGSMAFHLSSFVTFFFFFTLLRMLLHCILYVMFNKINVFRILPDLGFSNM